MLNSEADLVLPKRSPNLVARTRNPGPWMATKTHTRTVKPSRAGCTCEPLALALAPALGLLIPYCVSIPGGLAHGSEVSTASEQNCERAIAGDLTSTFRVQSACEQSSEMLKCQKCQSGGKTMILSWSDISVSPHF